MSCAESTLRRVPCTESSDCSDSQACIQGTCQPCGDLCVAAEIDAGEDAGEPDAGFDAGEPDAGSPDAGFEWDAGDPVLLNIDLSCGTADGGAVFPPKEPLAQTVPNSCLTGFEMNNFHASWSIPSIDPAGAPGGPLEIDIATYQAPDVIRMSAIVGGVEQDLLLTCRLKTADYSDPTRGLVRPPEEYIREFRVTLPAGTTALNFDFTAASTPTYIRVLGLCDFTLQPPAGIGRKWRLVNSR